LESCHCQLYLRKKRGGEYLLLGKGGGRSTAYENANRAPPCGIKENRRGGGVEKREMEIKRWGMPVMQWRGTASCPKRLEGQGRGVRAKQQGEKGKNDTLLGVFHPNKRSGGMGHQVSLRGQVVE